MFYKKYLYIRLEKDRTRTEWRQVEGFCTITDKKKKSGAEISVTGSGQGRWIRGSLECVEGEE